MKLTISDHRHLEDKYVADLRHVLLRYKGKLSEIGYMRGFIDRIEASIQERNLIESGTPEALTAFQSLET